MKDTLITKNKKAFFDYEVLESHEAGIELFGHEVKAIRLGHVNLKGAYVSNIGGYLQIKGMHVTPWKALPNSSAIDGKRERKIFLHKKDIGRLLEKVKLSGLTLIPLELYFKGSLIKVKIGLCKGKKDYDKKQTLKERTLDKEAKMYLKKFI